MQSAAGWGVGMSAGCTAHPMDGHIMHHGISSSFQLAVTSDISKCFCHASDTYKQCCSDL